MPFLCRRASCARVGGRWEALEEMLRVSAWGANVSRSRPFWLPLAFAHFLSQNFGRTVRSPNVSSSPAKSSGITKARPKRKCSTLGK